jgi:hypothetical protein
MEAFGDRATFLFTPEVDTHDWRSTDNTFRINPGWYAMQTEQARAWLLEKLNKQDQARRAHIKWARLALAEMGAS